MTMLLRTDAPMRQAIPAMLQTSAPVVVLTEAALVSLIHEAGSPEKAARWLVRQVSRYGKPIAVHHDGVTRFVAPSSWTQDRMKGYIAAHHEALEAQFGEVIGFTQGGQR